MKTPILAAAVLLAAAATQAPAATFYKLTEPNGRVTYLDRAPTEFPGRVEVITVDPDANTAKLPDNYAANAQTEAERIIRSGQAERLAEANAAQLQLQRAQMELAAARGALEQAQNNSLAEDWIYFANQGGRAPRPEYAARLESLDARVKLAEANLAEAERQVRLN